MPLEVGTSGLLTVGRTGSDLRGQSGEWPAIGDELIPSWRHANEADAVTEQRPVHGAEICGAQDLNNVVSTQVGRELVEQWVDLLYPIGHETLGRRSQLRAVDVVDATSKDRLARGEIKRDALQGSRLVSSLSLPFFADQLDLGRRLVGGVAPLNHGAGAVELDESVPGIGRELVCPSDAVLVGSFPRHRPQVVAPGLVGLVDVERQITSDDGLAVDGDLDLEGATTRYGQAGECLLEQQPAEPHRRTLSEVDRSARPFPVLLFGRLQLVAVLCLAQSIISDEAHECRRHIAAHAFGSYVGVEQHGDIRRMQRQSGHVHAQCDDLHHFGVDAFGAVLLGDVVYLGPPRRRDELLEEIVGTVERHERTDFVVANPALGIDYELLGKLDEGPIGTADGR